MMPDFEWMETVAYREGYRAGKEDALKDMIPKDYHDRVCEEMAKRHQAEIENMVEVVRCKECKHWNYEMSGCKRNPSVVAWRDNDFCSYGEERSRR